MVEEDPAARAAPMTAGGAAPSPEPAAPLLIELPELDELLDRLERIEEKLSDMQRPVRPVPAARDVFEEWVRLRRWEEMPFGDFLKLRRAGRI
ncbi:MAG TPA: hypothetical protein VJV23_11140 [Candidatus Polarisedimenticolia bacterium]|nr:hypothetical protein [Candidatus Polarisedimenticolia bacterium]